jgi:hypothetical protein
MTGRSLAARMRRQAWKPEMPGSHASRSTRSHSSRSITASASSPLLTRSTVFPRIASGIAYSSSASGS